MEPWQKVEGEASATRKRLAGEACARLLGGDARDMPRIGVCLSGGGWRAMTSGCALFDALAVPVEKRGKDAGGGAKVKPLDCVSHAFGLSGGSWMLFNTVAGGEYNSFHRTENPWLYGDAHHFDPAVHQYEGLAHMVSKEVVDEACHRGNFRKSIGFLSTKIGADATIAAALGSAELGPSLVERWANFIGNDILGWIDEEEDALLRNAAPGEHGVRALPPPALKKNTRNAESKSRNRPFSGCRDIIKSGALPYVVCAAIADIPGKQGPVKKKPEDGDADAAAATAAAAASNPATPRAADSATTAPTGAAEARKPVALAGPEARIYDWVEFTPWFARNPGTGTYFENVDDLCGKFWADDEPHPLRMHHLMAICGSAFACDLTCALPPSLTKAVKKHHLANVTNEPLIGRGTSTVVSKDGSRSLGVLRDAGIDFNIPLPPMLCPGREFDIILVMDAGAGSKNAFELARAAELGYIELAPDGPNPLDQFGAGHHVRVFRGATGMPIIIYLLGLCERGTHQIINHRPNLLEDVQRLRERVAKVVVPVLLAEMSIVMRMKQRARTTGVPLLGALSAVVSAAVGDDADDASELHRVLSETTLEEAPDEREDNENQAIEAMGPDVGDEVRAIMLRAAAEGRVKTMFDAHSTAEREIFARLFPDVKSRQMVIFKFETMALATFFPAATSTQPLATHGAAQSFVQDYPRRELYRLEFIEDDAISASFRLRATWNDYFAATALAASLARSDPAAIEVLGRTGVMPATTPNVIRNLPISRRTKMFTVLADCVVTMETRHANAAMLRKAFHDEMLAAITAFLARPGSSLGDKQLALDNFIAALTAARLDNEIMAFVEKVDQRSQVQIACAAARCGNFHVLQCLPALAVAKKSVLGAAYASSAAEDIIAWLKAEHNLSLTLEDAAELGFPEAASELVRSEENRDNLAAAVKAIEFHQEAVLAILWASASSRFKDVILGECGDHCVSWNPVTSKLTQLPREDAPAPGDHKARALETFAVLKDKALTPSGMEGLRNPRIRRKGKPLTDQEKQAEAERRDVEEKKSLSHSADEAKEKAAAAAKAAASKVFGFGSKLASSLTGGSKKHADPQSK